MSAFCLISLVILYRECFVDICHASFQVLQSYTNGKDKQPIIVTVCLPVETDVNSMTIQMSASFLPFLPKQLLVLTGVRYLQTAMENVLRLGDLDSESDGWLLENSIAETARSNFNIIKNLGKCYQVDDDPNINVPSVAQQEVPTRQIPVAS